MKIVMLRSKMGSNDGVTTKLYEEGQEYDVSETLAESFIGENLAEPVKEKKSKPADTPPEYIEGEVYQLDDGAVYLGVVADGSDDVVLLPVDQLTDEERAELVAEGKLTDDGKLPEQQKAEPKAPKNKAEPKAPKNKGA